MKKCKNCNEQNINSLLSYEETLCYNCRNKLKVNYKHQRLNKYTLYSFYEYNEHIRTIILKIKVQKDLALTKVLLKPFIWFLKIKFVFYRKTIAPSTNTSDLERGFNHVEEICKSSGIRVEKLFIKTSEWKQSDKNFKERSLVKKHISITKQKLAKRYLIIDDIVTSGNTLIACADLLKSRGVKRVVLLAMANNLKDK